MFANNYNFRHLARSLFFYVFLGRLGCPSVTEVLLVAVTVVLCHERVVRQRLYTPDVPVGSGRSKIVEMASGLKAFSARIFP